MSASERDGRSTKKSHPRGSYQSPRLPPLQRQPGLARATLKSRENICSGCPPLRPRVSSDPTPLPPPISTRVARLSCVPQPRVKNSINECCRSSIDKREDARPVNCNEQVKNERIISSWPTEEHMFQNKSEERVFALPCHAGDGKFVTERHARADDTNLL